MFRLGREVEGNDDDSRNLDDVGCFVSRLPKQLPAATNTLKQTARRTPNCERQTLATNVYICPTFNTLLQSQEFIAHLHHPIDASSARPP